ncbi:hypothetical protein ZTR_02970 [Talaromyces verruculosus]|nr:hypothetical protein ZTR_02970 [Talaromyces verruculosus]
MTANYPALEFAQYQRPNGQIPVMDEKNRHVALSGAATTNYAKVLFICFYINIWTFITGPILESIESTHHGDHDGSASSVVATQCPAQYAIAPHSSPDITKRNIEKLFPSAEFRNLSVKRLSGAVQIPTVSYDDNGPVGEDPRWDVFFDLERYFRETFPLLHETLEQEIVNVHGLVYTWHGSDPSLKPILLTGHQDVVPIQQDTLSDWKYPPFSGYFDGTYINGRGSHDCKNNVVGIMAAVEALIEAGFTPRRTVVLGFGFDEESPTLMLGAYHISRHLKRVWGDKFGDSLPFALLLDEGLIGIQKMYNRTFGIPQASEKGMLDVKFRVHVPGGHSSNPPAHGSIGILSQAVSALEDSYRPNFPSTFTSNNPYYYQIHCAAEDEHADMSPVLRDAILNQAGRPDVDHPKLTELLVKEDPESDIYLHTTQAITIFNSGNKANVIPENAEMLANYRISNEENISIVQERIVETIKPLAEKFNLRLIVREEDDDDKELPVNSFSISWWRRIEPSPVSSHESSPVWNHLAGVIKHVFDEPGDGNDVIVAPTMAVGNTDTKYYWDLSEQIYRFGPVRIWHDEGWGNLHSVNERIALDAHMESLTFYHELIRVFDEADLAH